MHMRINDSLSCMLNTNSGETTIRSEWKIEVHDLVRSAAFELRTFEMEAEAGNLEAWLPVRDCACFKLEISNQIEIPARRDYYLLSIRLVISN